MKRIIGILLALLFALGGCAAGGAPGPEAPGSTPAPWPKNAPYEIIAFGGKRIASSNCLSIDFAEADGSVTATMTFASGSERNGTAQSIAESVPEYRAYLTGTPQRFVVEFYELNYWDYDRSLDLSAAERLLHGVFRQFQNNDERFRIIFQLKEGATASVKEEGGKLAITFTPEEIDTSAKWYAVADALSAFSEGTAEGVGLFPVLCRCGRTTLISRPFDTKDEAEAFIDELPESVLARLGEGGAGAQALAGNSLPVWSNISVNAAVYQTPVVELDGEPTILPVVMEDGIYLCSSPDGGTAVFSRMVRQDGQEDIAEELWAMDDSGGLTRLTEADFSAIIMAAYSPDGRKLAILERAEEITYLYVLDLDTGKLTNISDFGLGKLATRFIWDLLGSEIYVMSGNDSLELMKYDFTIHDETRRITVVEDKEIEDGDLAFFNGDLYFSNPDKDGNPQIYRIKPEGGMRMQVTRGDSFAISPDGRYMAILESSSQGGGANETRNNTSIKLRSMTTGEESYLVRERYIVNLEWGQSGLLYYSEGVVTGPNDGADDAGAGDEEQQPEEAENAAPQEPEFGFTLYSFDLNTQQTTKCADMIAADFMVTPDPAVLFIPYYYADETTNLRATYKLELRG